MKKCKNCDGGQVDGGFRKQQKRDIDELYKKRDKEINQVKGQNAEEVREKKSAIYKKFDQLIHQKSNEVAKRISTCYYCEGRGYR